MSSHENHVVELDEVLKMFSDRAIAEAIKRAGLSVDKTACKRIRAAIRGSIAEFIITSRRPTMNTIRRELDATARAFDASDEDEDRYYRQLSKMWKGLSDDARQTLERRLVLMGELEEQRLAAYDQFAARRGGRMLRPRPIPEFAGAGLPTSADLEDRERRVSARDLLFQLIVTGRGRDWERSDEPGADHDKRRHNQRRLRLHAPMPSRAEPRREAVQSLVSRLSSVWADATGQQPTLTARRDAVGPFARLVAEILDLARVPVTNDHDDDRHGLAVETLNHTTVIRKRRQAERSLRRILNPLRVRHTLVDEVRRLIELGKAEVIQVGAEAHCDHDPQKPAMIEFRYAGTVCFFRPPFGWQTIAIKPFPLRRIVRLAQQLAASNAGRGRALAAARQRRLIKNTPHATLIARSK